MSCDLEPTENDGPHYQGDVTGLLAEPWDLVIGHPPCQFLANSGVGHLVRGGKRINPERWEAMRQGAEFFRLVLNANAERVCIENPVIHGYAKEIIGCSHDQTIQPYEFGHDASKRTCLWLKNLPPLVKDPAAFVPASHPGKNGRKVYANQTPSGQNKLGPSDDRAKIRAETYLGVADAMARQWGRL